MVARCEVARHVHRRRSGSFERLVAASGLPPIQLHGLCHRAATLMLAAGVDVKVVSDALGHSDTRIPCDIYQSVLPQVDKNPTPK